VDAAVRSGAIALTALIIAPLLTRQLAAAGSQQRTWALLLAPMLTPALLVSYVYAPWVVHPGALPAIYFAALTLKLVPLAAVVQHFLPPALSAEAAHCHALSGMSRGSRWLFRLRGAGRAPWVAGGLVFLLAFSDFELASLWSVKTWTVVLFDAQAGGLALAESLRLAAVPLGIELLAVFIVIRRPAGGPLTARNPPPSNRADRAALAYLLIAAAVMTLVPVFVISVHAAAGFRSVWENFALANEALVSLGFGLAAAAGAWPLARWLASRRAPALAACVPGLLGALLLSLLLLAAFQSRLLHPLYDTPLPLLCALVMLLLPPAIPLAWLLAGAQRDPALHLARLADARAIAWQLDGRRRGLAIFLLFCAAYFDLTAGSILAPVGLTPIFARLHNLAHYGQTAVLSAMILTAFLLPALVLVAGGMAARIHTLRG
jgi:hypothetical protein